MKEGVKIKILNIIQEQMWHLKRKPVEDDNFINDLGFDSLDAVETIMFLEEEFDIEIDDMKATKVKTIKDLLELMEPLI